MIIFDVDEASEVLSDRLRGAWRLVASALPAGQYRLVGGTAVAAHLLHRESFDLDFMADHPFDSQELFSRFAHIPEVALSEFGDSWLEMDINGAKVQMFRQTLGASRTLPPRWLSPGAEVSGIVVASIPDLMASKLEVLLRRGVSRDYFDLAAMDQQSQYKLERGLRFHRDRYGAPAHATDQIIDKLEDPGDLLPDSALKLEMETVLRHLKSRVPNLRHAVELERQITPSSPFAGHYQHAKRASSGEGEQ